MSNLSTQYFTDAGVDMLGHANAGELLTISKIVVGAGSAATPDDIYPLTALIDWRNDVVITRKIDQGNGKLLVSGRISEHLISGNAYELREIGVMAQITGSAEKLYCAGNVFNEPPATITPGGTSSYAFDILIEIGKATNIAVTVGDSTTVDCENIPTDATVGPGWYAQRFGNIFQFKRAVQGSGIVLTEQADRVIIAAKQLTNNVDLYVPTTHPQAPSPNVAFPSIQAAHDYLLSFYIPNWINARIHVASGTLSHSTQINITHPQGRQIQILGATLISANVGAINNVNTQQFNIAISANPGFAVGHWVILRRPADWRWYGARNILSVSGLVIGLNKLFLGGTDFSLSSSGGTLWRYPSELYFSGCNGFVVSKNGLGLLQNLTLRGSGTSGMSGLVGGCDKLYGVLVCYFTGGQGLWFTNPDAASLELVGLAYNNIGAVIEAGAQVTSSQDCWMNGNLYAGVWARYGGLMYFGSMNDPSNCITTFNGNQEDGGYASLDGNLSFNYCYAGMNRRAYRATERGMIQGGWDTSGKPNSCNSNTDWDIYLNTNSYAHVNKRAGVFAKLSPASGQVGNNNSFMLVG